MRQVDTRITEPLQWQYDLLPRIGQGDELARPDTAPHRAVVQIDVRPLSALMALQLQDEAVVLARIESEAIRLPKGV